MKYLMRHLDFLWKHQKVLNLTDAELARKLGISQSYISRLKAGERPATPYFTRIILKAFPELGAQISRWLLEWVEDETILQDASTRAQ